MKLMPTLVVSLMLCGSLLMSTRAHGAPDGGCGTEDLTAGSQSITVISSGVTRAVLLYVPGGAATRHALPLVLDLHASGSNGKEQARLSRLPELAAKVGFIVANPNGGVTLPGAPDEHYWNIPGVPLSGGAQTPADAPGDVRFINDTIDTISRKTCIDPRRIYVTGMSGGARMASLLACQLSARIAAIAPVSGLRAGLPSNDTPSQPVAASCQPRRAVPIVTFHGTGDSINRYEGDTSTRWGYSIPAALKRWAQLDHCQGEPRERRITAHVTLERYGPCQQGTEIWLYRTDASGEHGGGHAWPGSIMPVSARRSLQPERLRANTPGTEINASDLMWQFFKRHPLPVDGK
jgi:polyhydroxybutyrate depolymerase